jgi:hypothetical protein
LITDRRRECRLFRFRLCDFQKRKEAAEVASKFCASGNLATSATPRKPVQEALLPLLLLDVFLKHSRYAVTPVMQTLLGTELFVAVAMAGKPERARAEITSVRFHLTPFP